MRGARVERVRSSHGRRRTGDGNMGPLLDPRFSGRTRAAVNWHTEPVNWHGEFPELRT